MPALMPLPDFTLEPLAVPVPLAPLPNQLPLIPDFEEINMAPKTAEKPVKPSRKKVTVKPPPTEDLDRDGMLREACGGMQRQADWNLLRFGATNNSILDLLADIWGGGWGHSNPEKGWTWCAKGGAKPGIWFGIPSPIGPASLTGEKLAAAVRRLMEIPEPGATAEQDQQSQRDALLVRALLGTEGAESRWRRVFSGAVVSAVDILGQLADEWQGGPGHIGPDGEYVTRGGKRPAIWFSGSTRGEPDLSGQHLADAIKRLKIDGLLLPGSPASGSGIDAARTETDDELLLRALDPGHDRWRLARENTELPDGELYQLLKITWKKPIAFLPTDGDDARLRAYYARSNPYPAIWFDAPAAVEQPAFGAAALLAEVRRVLHLPGQATPEPPAAPPTMESAELPIDKIRVVKNDRKEFDQVKLEELAASLGGPLGILQPLLVGAPDGEGMYPLIAGERRLRAARIAGLSTVPVRIAAFDDRETALARLTENLMRVDLNPMEEAQALSDMLQMGETQRQLAERLKIGQSTIAHRVNLLKLPPSLQQALISGQISVTEGRDLATWADRPAVIAEFLSIWGENIEFQQAKRFHAMLRQAVVESSCALGRGPDGPRFKVTDDIRSELDIVAVKLPGLDEERAFNVDRWRELQTDALLELEQKKAKREAAKQTASTQPAGKAKPPTLPPHQVTNFWINWAGQQIVAEFRGKKLKQPQVELLRRIALLVAGDPLDAMTRHWSINWEGAIATLLNRNLDALLDAITTEFLTGLENGYGLGVNDAADAIAIVEACGITLDAFAPSAESLKRLPLAVLQAWIAEYDVTPAQGGEELEAEDDALAEQLAEVWTPGWIPAELDFRTGEQA